jgi:hypothetical protein
MNLGAFMSKRAFVETSAARISYVENGKGRGPVSSRAPAQRRCCGPAVSPTIASPGLPAGVAGAGHVSRPLDSIGLLSGRPWRAPIDHSSARPPRQS